MFKFIQSFGSTNTITSQIIGTVKVINMATIDKPLLALFKTLNIAATKVINKNM